MMNPLSIFTAVINPVANYFAKRTEVKEATKQKNIERLQNADDSVAEWDKIQAENSANSWKDEFWTIVLAIPAIGCFIPGGAEVMTAGFTALKGMPEFYQYWLGIAILASFGIKMTR